MAHLDVGLGSLPFDVFQDPSLATVPGLHPLLGPLERLEQRFGIAAEPRPQARGDPLGPLGAVALHEDVVVERHILPPGAGVALPAAAADELAVDACGVMEFRADHVQAAEFLHAVAKLDVGAAASHVRRDGDLPMLARLRDDLRLSLDVPRVEHGVYEARLGEHLGELLRLVDRPRADQHGPAHGMHLGHLGDDPRELVGLVGADGGRQPLTDRRPVGGDHRHGHVVGPRELAGARGDRAGHARQVGPAGEEILDRDPSGVARGHGDFDLFLGLHRLMQAVLPAAALGGAAGKLVDDHDLAVADDVLPVAAEESAGAERPLDGVVDLQQARRVELRGPLERPHAAAAAAEQFAGLLLDILLEIFVGFERGGDIGRKPKQGLLGGLGLAGRGGDDQRRAGLVDQHVVGLVDERKPEGPLEQLCTARRGSAGELGAEVAAPLVELPLDQPVLEEVEAKLLGRAVGDVAGVGLAPLVEIHLRLDDAHFQAEGLVDRRHPFSVAAGEVVVDRGEVGALAGEGIEHEGQRGHERLAFARLHLGDRPLHER